MRGIRLSRMDADSRGFGTGHGRARTCAESDRHGWTRTVADSEPVTDEHEHARNQTVTDGRGQSRIRNRSRTSTNMRGIRLSRMDADNRGFGDVTDEHEHARNQTSRMGADSRGLGTGHGRARTCADQTVTDGRGQSRIRNRSQTSTNMRGVRRSRMDADSRGFGDVTDRQARRKRGRRCKAHLRIAQVTQTRGAGVAA